jgi:hypothetical protein
MNGVLMPRVLNGRSFIRLCLCLAFLAILTSVLRAANPLFVPVDWQTTANVTIASGAVTKTSGCDGCPDGSVMSAPLPTTGDVYIRFVPNATGTMVAGLIQNGTTLSASAFALGFQLSGDGYWEVRESGVWVAEGMAGPTDEFRIGLEGDQVRYYVSGHVVYSRNRTAETSYRLAAIFSAMGAGLADAAVATTSVTSQPAYAPVLWTDAANLTVGGSTVTKTSGCDGCPDAFAVSGSQTGSQDAYLEFPAVLDKRIVVGFIPTGEAVSLGAIDYGVGFFADGGWDVREGDGYRVDGTTGQGDIFRIALEGTRVTYYRNGWPIWTSARRDGISYRAVVLDYSSGGTLGGADLAINSAPIISPPGTPHFALATPGSMAIGAVDPEHDAMTFSASGLPSGLSLNPYSGIIAGTPTSAGESAVSVTAADLHGGTNTISFTLVVDNTSPASTPTLTSVSPSSAAKGTQVTLIGTNFGAQADGAYVWLGTVPGTVVTWSATQIVARVDPDAASGIAQVRFPTGQSNSLSFTVAGVAAPCTYSVSPLALSIPAAGQMGTFTVTTSPACAWSGTSQVPWISLTPATGTTTGTVSYNIDENISASARSSTVVLAGQTVEITQGAGVERTGPVGITTRVSPEANPAGWHNTAVTVSFTCSNANVCPPPVIVGNEGVGQVISGAASNSDHSATASVTLNIDRTAPTITLVSPLPTPANGALALSGSAVDALSGVTSTTCNGASASFDGLNVVCSVPVRYGVNTVVMQVVDAAGNGASMGDATTVAGTASILSIAPARRTLLVGQSITMSARDEGGFVQAGLTWSSDNAAVASITPDGTLTANAAGAAIMTAVSGALSATATVDVVAGTSIPPGSVHWSVDPATGYELTDTLVQRSPDGTEFVRTVSKWDETVGEWGAYTDVALRGLNAAGEETYTIHANLEIGEHVIRAMGDSEGGVIMIIRNDGTSSAEYTYYQQHGGAPLSLVRIDPTTSYRAWRQPLGLTSQIPIGSIAISADGTVYGIGGGNGIGNSEVFGFDVLTGRMKFRSSLPLSSVHYRSPECPQLASDGAPLPKVSPLKVDSKGWASFVVTTQVFKGDIHVNPGTCVVSGTSDSSRTVKVTLFRISPAGVVQTIGLSEYAADPSLDVSAGLTLPGDYDGGLFASWGWCTYAGHPNTPACYQRARYLGLEGLGAEFEVSNIPVISASGRKGYGFYGAIDLETGAELWSLAAPAAPAAALSGGDVLYAGLGTATVFGPSGAVVTSGQSPFYSYDGTGSVSFSPLAIVGDVQFGSVDGGARFAALASNNAHYIDPLSAYPTVGGSPAKTGAQPDCVPKPRFAPRPGYPYGPLSTARDYKFAFADEIPNFPNATKFGTFTEAQKSLFLPQFIMWRFGGVDGFPDTSAITRLTAQTETANLVIQVGRTPTVVDLDGAVTGTGGEALYPMSLHLPSTDAIAERAAASLPNFPLEKFGIIFNAAYVDTSTPVRTNLFKFFALHEFGHVIGLDDVSKTCSYETSVMARPGLQTLFPPAPTENDKKGLRRVLNIR